MAAFVRAYRGRLLHCAAKGFVYLRNADNLGRYVDACLH